MARRDPHNKARSFAHIACDVDRATMKIDDHFHEIQSDTSAYDTGDIAATVVSVEQVLEITGRDSDSVVCDLDNDLVG